MIEIKIGERLSVAASYESDSVARRFWRASFRTDRSYNQAPDALGQPMLIKHEREEDQSYMRRIRSVKPRNYVGPLIRLYNDYVFRRQPTRAPKIDPIGQSLVDDADGKGKSLDAFMRQALLLAEVDRESYILIDRESDMEPDTETVTMSQAAQMNARPVLRLIDARAVINWTDYCGQMIECLIVMQKEDGTWYARKYTESFYQDYVLKGGPPTVQRDGTVSVSGVMSVESAGPEIDYTEYGGLPIVRLRPIFDMLEDSEYIGDSQAGPIAEAQQGIVNALSLRNEEMFNSAFSQFAAIGVSADQVADAKMGNNRLLCIPNPGGSFQVIGSDPAQSKVICDNIMDDVANLYRAAGIISTSPDAGTPESGVALGMRFNQLSANLSALAQSVSEAEVQIWNLLSEAWKFPLPDETTYHSDFDQPDMQKELALTVLGVASQGIPAEVKSKLVQWFSARNLNMKPEEVAIAMDAKASEAPSASPFPATFKQAS